MKKKKKRPELVVSLARIAYFGQQRKASGKIRVI